MEIVAIQPAITLKESVRAGEFTILREAVCKTADEREEHVGEPPVRNTLYYFAGNRVREDRWW